MPKKAQQSSRTEEQRTEWRARKDEEKRIEIRKKNLISAINAGNQGEVIEFAEQLPTVNEDIFGKGNILVIAAQEGFEKVVEHILKNHMKEISQQNLDLALIEAKEGNHLEIEQFLIAKGADINFVDSKLFETDSVENRLRIALEHRDEEAAVEIINNEMDTHQLNTRITKDGSTPLMLIAHKGLKSLISPILAKDVEVEYSNKYGTALTFAMNHEDLKNNDISLSLVAYGASLHESENPGLLVTNAMFEERPNTAKILKLVDAMHDIDRKIYNKMTAVELAAYLGNEEVVDGLIERGVSLIRLDKIGRGGKGAEGRKKKNRDGGNALHCAIDSGNTNIVRSILAAAGNLKVKNKDGNEIAYIDILDGNGVSALKKAQFHDYTEIAGLLEEKGANKEIGTMPHQNIEENQRKLKNLGRYIKQGKDDQAVELITTMSIEDLNSLVEGKRTAYRLAIETNRPKILDALKERGINTTIESRQYGNALDIAQRTGNPAIVNRVIEYSVDMDGASGVLPLYSNAGSNNLIQDQLYQPNPLEPTAVPRLRGGVPQQDNSSYVSNIGAAAVGVALGATLIAVGRQAIKAAGKWTTRTSEKKYEEKGK